MGLGNADWEFSESELFKLGSLLFGGWSKDYATAMVDFLDDLIEFLFDRSVEFIAEAEVIWFFAKADDFFRKFDATIATIGPNGREFDVDAELFAFPLDKFDFGIGVGWEAVDCDDAWKLIDGHDVVDMSKKVWKAFFKGDEIFLAKFGLL